MLTIHTTGGWRCKEEAISARWLHPTWRWGNRLSYYLCTSFLRQGMRRRHGNGDIFKCQPSFVGPSRERDDMHSILPVSKNCRFPKYDNAQWTAVLPVSKTHAVVPNAGGTAAAAAATNLYVCPSQAGEPAYHQPPEMQKKGFAKK